MVDVQRTKVTLRFCNDPLDLIWFDEEGSIVYMVEDASPCKNTLDTTNCTFKNTKPAKYILAATSGFIDEHKITERSKMNIISI